MSFTVSVASETRVLAVLTFLIVSTLPEHPQLCEVEFTLTQAGIGATPTHKIRAALTPDGSRAFQIDGKNKSAAQIKVGVLCLCEAHHLLVAEVSENTEMTVQVKCDAHMLILNLFSLSVAVSLHTRLRSSCVHVGFACTARP